MDWIILKPMTVGQISILFLNRISIFILFSLKDLVLQHAQASINSTADQAHEYAAFIGNSNRIMYYVVINHLNVF